MSDLIKLSLQKRAVGSVVASPTSNANSIVLKRGVGNLAYLQGREHPARETRAIHEISSDRSLPQMEHSLSHALRHRALVHVNDGEEDRLLRFMELLTLFDFLILSNSRT